MSTTLNAEIIKGLVQDLEAGFAIYVNKDTGELKTILDHGDYYDLTGNDYWEKEMEEIENEWPNLAVVHPPASHESFEYMETFVNKVDEKGFRAELINTLNKRRPFATFKALVESSKYREEWFLHRSSWHYNYLVTQLSYDGIHVAE